MDKIEKLVAPYCDNHSGCGGASYDEVINKINEIIDALNGKEDPELAESEDERIREEIIGYLNSRVSTAEETELLYFKRWIAWLEKQKEQKPASTEDMPYITDEHFYEREPADSFKYKLAEYMTKCCTKKEGPYGYEYGISAESILKMAKEELIKRGELKEQKPSHTAKEMWKEMRLEVYAQASGNRHEPNYSDDSTKMFSLCDIDEIFEKIGNSTVGSQPVEWSEEDKKDVEMLSYCN